MIKGTGMDVVEVARIRRSVENERFVARVYTPKEIEYCRSRGTGAVQSFAARFAGKEAVLKAFGTGLRGGKLTDIEILPDELGCPQTTLSGYFADLAQKQGIGHVLVTLSHTKDFAAAQCIMEGK